MQAAKKNPQVQKDTGDSEEEGKRQNSEKILTYEELDAIMTASHVFSFDLYNPEREEFVPRKFVFARRAAR